MRKTYDFSKAKRNPYASRLKKQITIRIDMPTIDYFATLAEDMGIPYRALINLDLRECAATKKKLALTWEPSKMRDAS